MGLNEHKTVKFAKRMKTPLLSKNVDSNCKISEIVSIPCVRKVTHSIICSLMEIDIP